jgi:hypothetical protein
MRENFTHTAVYEEPVIRIGLYLGLFRTLARLASALLKKNSEIRLTAVVIHLKSAACPRMKKQQHKRISH